MSVLRRAVRCFDLMLILLAGLVLGMGCGSNGPVRQSALSLPSGRATFSITWPAPTRLIPAASNSIKVQVNNGSTPITSQILARPSGGGTATVSFDPLPVGNLTVIATAYPTTNGTGIAQATASIPLVIQASQNTPFSLTMASTIDHVTISPATITVQATQSAQLTATAYDASGNVVLTSALSWSSSNRSVATVSQSGSVTGVSAGSAQISVLETESGKSTFVPTTVTLYVEPAIAYQIDTAHTGRTTFGVPLTFPSAPTWTVNLGGQASYPLVVNGIVYVTTSGAQLYALDVATGKSVWGPVPAATSWTGLAYDNGKIFMINMESATIWSYNAVTGVQGWHTQLPGQFGAASLLTALNGTIYVAASGIGGTFFAVDEGTGAVDWTASVMNGNESAPVVTSDGRVYASYSFQDYEFSSAGSLVWYYNGGSEGGGGHTPVLANGLLYARNFANSNNVILNATTGQKVGTFICGPIPVIGTTMGYFQDAPDLVTAGTLRGINLSSMTTVWSFTGDNQISSAPLVIDNTVFIGSTSGNLYALDGTTGAQLWSANAGAMIYAPDEINAFHPVTGFAAAEGYLFVPAGNTLTAWKLTSP
jgi:outer membrane protein assembly factor BamB